jgi:hypothetical protein
VEDLTSTPRPLHKLSSVVESSNPFRSFASLHDGDLVHDLRSCEPMRVDSFQCPSCALPALLSSFKYALRSSNRSAVALFIAPENSGSFRHSVRVGVDTGKKSCFLVRQPSSDGLCDSGDYFRCALGWTTFVPSATLTNLTLRFAFYYRGVHSLCKRHHPRESSRERFQSIDFQV